MFSEFSIDSVVVVFPPPMGNCQSMHKKSCTHLYLNAQKGHLCIMPPYLGRGSTSSWVSCGICSKWMQGGNE